MGVISDEFPAVMQATQAHRILGTFEGSTYFSAYRSAALGEKPWRVLCDGQSFDGETLTDAMAQCAQWLEVKGV